jgi:hypothetical protein
MTLKGLECQVSRLINSDTIPRPTIQAPGFGSYMLLELHADVLPAGAGAAGRYQVRKTPSWP